MRRSAPIPRAAATVLTVGLALAVGGCGADSASNTSVRGTVREFNTDLNGHRWADACALLTVTGRQIILSEDAYATSKTTCAEAMPRANVRQALIPKRMTAAQITAAKLTRLRHGAAMLQDSAADPAVYVLSEQRGGHWLIESL